MHYSILLKEETTKQSEMVVRSLQAQLTAQMHLAVLDVCIRRVAKIWFVYVLFKLLIRKDLSILNYL